MDRAPLSVTRNHPAPDEVPGLEEVAHALHQARRAFPIGPGFRAGICDDSREIVSAANLVSFQQLRRFTEEMGKLGYRPRIGGSEADMQGCDVVFLPASVSA
jgi:hypothetical protein